MTSPATTRLLGCAAEEASAAHARFCCGSAALSRHGVRCALAALTGKAPCAAEVDALVAACGTHGVTEAALVAYAQSRSGEQGQGAAALEGEGADVGAGVGAGLAQRESAAVRAAFRALDARCDGFVSKASVREAAVACGLAKGRDDAVVAQLEAAFDELDDDADGRLSASEFFAAMTMAGI